MAAPQPRRRSRQPAADVLRGPHRRRAAIGGVIAPSPHAAPSRATAAAGERRRPVRSGGGGQVASMFRGCRAGGARGCGAWGGYVSRPRERAGGSERARRNARARNIAGATLYVGTEYLEFASPLRCSTPGSRTQPHPVRSTDMGNGPDDQMTRATLVHSGASTTQPHLETFNTTPP